MIEVNTSTVKSDIKSFQSFSENHLRQAIDQAETKAGLDDLDDTPAYNLAVIDYARHILVVDRFQDYGVVSSNDLGESESLANPNTYDDAYLKAYNNIADNLGDSGGSIDFYNNESYNPFK